MSRREPIRLPSTPTSSFKSSLGRADLSFVRCPACGALNPDAAQWCGQCLRRFSDGPVEGRPGVEESAADERASHDRAGLAGPWHVRDTGITWTCTRCGSSNELEARSCSTCGTGFAAAIAAPVERPQRDPSAAALYSLLLPGAGHAYAGLRGQGMARALMSAWVVSVCVVALLNGSLVLGVTFGAAATGLWLAAAHDAYWAAKNADRRALLVGRRWTYVTTGLIGVLFLALVAGLTAARGT
jgi:ribosomal protein L40E